MFGLLNGNKNSPTEAMLENAPTNVIYANKNLNVQYLNPAAKKTLKTLEQYLPAKVDELIGRSIDIFHKDPAHQRKILQDPRNLPHQALIQVGPEKLDLLVSAIYDNKQNYLGPMISWSVMTEKLELQEREKQNKEKMAAVLNQLGGVVQCLRKIQKKLSVISPARQPNAENAAKEAGVVSESKKEVSANVNAGRAGTEEINASIEELQRFLKALKTVC